MLTTRTVELVRYEVRAVAEWREILLLRLSLFCFFFSSRRRHTRYWRDWSSDVCSSDLLGSAAEGAIEFGVVETGRGAGATALGDGSPFYLSWAPEGDELIAHVGRTELVRLSLDGSTRDVDVPSVFNVPVWTPDDALIYGTGDERGQRLVVRDADAERSRTLVRFRAGLTFVVSPDGQRVAYQEVSPLGGGPLMMVDVASGETTEVADHLVAAYSWSPDGTKVLYLDAEGTGQDLAFRWVVWDRGVVVQTPRFVPSGLLEREYLPFFEQYAQSMTQWSPDSHAFAYAG